jgi:hypothetical protein
VWQQKDDRQRGEISDQSSVTPSVLSNADSPEQYLQPPQKLSWVIPFERCATGKHVNQSMQWIRSCILTQKNHSRQYLQPPNNPLDSFS